MSRSEIERAVSALLEQEWSIGDEVRFTDPSSGTTAPRVGTIVRVQPTSVEVDIGDRVVRVEKSRLQGTEPTFVPEPAFAPELDLEPVAPPQFPGHRDFRDSRVRRISTALSSIRMEVDELLSEIGAHRDAGNWDLEVADLPDYRSRLRTVDGLIGRLLQP